MDERTCKTIPHYDRPELNAIPGITNSAAGVMSCLLSSVSMKGGEYPFCFASYQCLADSISRTTRTVSRAIGVLKSLGLVVVVRTRGFHAIYPTSLVLKYIPSIPNLRMSSTFREHELLYEKKWGCRYRQDRAQINRRLDANQKAIREGEQMMTRIEEQRNAIVSSSYIGESHEMPQGNAIIEMEPTGNFHCVDDDGFGNQDFYASTATRAVPSSATATGNASRRPCWKERKARTMKRHESHHGRHDGGRRSNGNASASLPWEPKNGVPENVKSDFDAAMNEFAASPVKGMSPQEFGFVKCLQEHRDYMQYVPLLFTRIPQPQTPQAVQEWSKIPELYGYRVGRQMSLAEAEEFHYYNTCRGWLAMWPAKIADFRAIDANKGYLDQLPDLYGSERGIDSNFTDDASMMYQIALSEGRNYDMFLDTFRRTPKYGNYAA